MTNCPHENTEFHVVSVNGTPSRHCLDCGMYVLFWDDIEYGELDDDEEDDYE